VLRGGKALSIPYPSFSLKLRHEDPASSIPLEIAPKEMGQIAKSLIHKFSESHPSLDLSPQLKGRLYVENLIPTGAGLGSSASLCVAFCQWMSSLGFIDSTQILAEATKLENIFHGTSSGLDTATVASDRPILFSKEGGIERLPFRKIPKFTLHDTGLRMSTKIAVSQVAAFRERFPDESGALDQQMRQATDLALQGLHFYQEEAKKGISQVREAMRMAGGCFEAWGLVPLEAKQAMNRLKEDGALETKLTGAGGGGFVVALWE